MLDLDIIKNAYSLPRLYDFLYQEEGDTQFYIDLIKDHKFNSILELACGTGRISVPILEANKEVKLTGIDISKDMIDYFKEKTISKKFTDRLEILEGDIRKFKLDKKYNCVILANNSLSHMLEDSDLEAVFTKTKEHLDKDGIFVFSVLFPNLKALSKDKDNIYYVSSLEDPNTDDIVRIYESMNYDHLTQIIEVSWYFIRDKDEGIDSNLKRTFPIRVFFRKEMEYILKSFGFEIVEVYGEYDKTPLKIDSINQIYITKLR